MQPQAVIDFRTGPSHRTLVGHFFAIGVYVFIFGALAYLAFLNQGGIPGQLLLIYLSSVPLAIAIGTVVEIARAEKRLAAHHVVAGCLNAVLLCGVGGIWVVFKEQVMLTLLGSLVLVWLTKYSPAAQFLQPPSLSDVAGVTPLLEHRTARTVATLAGALALLVGGLGLSGLAVFGQMQRPG
ncbi:MAG TPA: hypothetical protein VJQ08_12490, partial [Candidatus Dormibacteraeota bacterium]|nr:hypothetical protein [Candidatus Dormibacteraeota bacterium]